MPFNSQLPQSEKSSGNLQQIPSNQTNAPEIPQEFQSRSLVEFCEVGGGGIFLYLESTQSSFTTKGTFPYRNPFSEDL